MFFPLRCGSVAFLVFFLHSLLLPLPLCALPLQPRQANGPSKTVTTVQTTDSPLGPVTVTCVLVFTPVKDAQGRDVVQEVKTCTLAMSASRSGNGSPTTTTTTSTLPPTTTTTTLTATATSTSPTVSSSAAALTTSTTATPTPTPTPSSTAISTPTTPVEAPPLAADATRSTTVPPVQTSSATTSGVGAAADLQLPGKKLSVLPIGLGVFAGISVIALIVVGLVTYERAKYRKAFRQRKLAESGAEMGYGGMAY